MLKWWPKTDTARMDPGGQADTSPPPVGGGRVWVPWKRQQASAPPVQNAAPPTYATPPLYPASAPSQLGAAAQLPQPYAPYPPPAAPLQPVHAPLAAQPPYSSTWHPDSRMQPSMSQGGNLPQSMPLPLLPPQARPSGGGMPQYPQQQPQQQLQPQYVTALRSPTGTGTVNANVSLGGAPPRGGGYTAMGQQLQLQGSQEQFAKAQQAKQELWGGNWIFWIFVPYIIATALQDTHLQTGLIVATSVSGAVLLLGAGVWAMNLRKVRAACMHLRPGMQPSPGVACAIHS